MSRSSRRRRSCPAPHAGRARGRQPPVLAIVERSLDRDDVNVRRLDGGHLPPLRPNGYRTVHHLVLGLRGMQERLAAAPPATIHRVRLVQPVPPSACGIRPASPRLSTTTSPGTSLRHRRSTTTPPHDIASPTIRDDPTGTTLRHRRSATIPAEHDIASPTIHDHAGHDIASPTIHDHRAATLRHRRSATSAPRHCVTDDPRPPRHDIASPTIHDHRAATLRHRRSTTTAPRHCVTDDPRPRRPNLASPTIRNDGPATLRHRRFATTARRHCVTDDSQRRPGDIASPTIRNDPCRPLGCVDARAPRSPGSSSRSPGPGLLAGRCNVCDIAYSRTLMGDAGILELQSAFDHA